MLEWNAGPEAVRAVQDGHKRIYRSLNKQKVRQQIMSGDYNNLEKKASIASCNYFCPSVDRGFDDPAKSTVHVQVNAAQQKTSAKTEI